MTDEDGKFDFFGDDAEINAADIVSALAMQELPYSGFGLLLSQYAAISISCASAKSSPAVTSTDPKTKWSIKDMGNRLATATGEAADLRTFHTKEAREMAIHLVDMAKKRGWSEVHIDAVLAENDIVKSPLHDRMRLFVWEHCQAINIPCIGFTPSEEDRIQLASIERVSQKIKPGDNDTIPS